MKAKLAIVLLLGFVICRSALAQTNLPADGKPADPGPANTAAQPGAANPLIQFQDAKLTEVIENLARLAAINYILDPKVTYGQPGPDGKPLPQPSISLRWENQTAEQALSAVLNNYSLQMVEDPKTKIVRITTKDPAAPDPLVARIIQLKYANPSNIAAAVTTTFTDPKRSKVLADPRTSQLVIVATEKELASLDDFLSQLDRPTRQVLIESRMMQMSRNPKTVKGIDWTDTLQAQHFSYGNGVVQQALTTLTAPGTPVTVSPATTVTLPGGRTITTPAVVTTPGSTVATTVGGTSSGGSGSSGGSSGASGGASGGTTPGGGLIPNGLSLNTLSGLAPNIGFLNADGLHAVLSFLNQDSDAQVISTPRVVTLDNQAASLNSGLRVPVRDTTASTANTTAGSTVRYEEVGTTLLVTPRISADDYIFLNVQVTNRDIVAFIPYTTPGGGGGQDPETQSREISTLVLIRNANTLVMGGLITDSVNNNYTKVPLFGDIPLLGLAFRHESKERNKQNMLIFVTPTIVQDSDFQPTQTQFLKSAPFEPNNPHSINPNSPWDSGRPHDWSSPKAKSNSNRINDEKGVAEPKG